MISLAGEYTDGKGRHARGWLFYDAECGFCARFAGWMAPMLARRGMAVGALQDPRVGALLGIGREELLREMRFLGPDGTQHGGGAAIVGIAREVDWARPLVWMARIPGAMAMLEAGYRWIAGQRSCAAVNHEACAAARRN